VKAFRSHVAKSHKDLSELQSEEMCVYTIHGKELVDKIVQQYVDEHFAITSLPIPISKYITLIGKKRSASEEKKTKRYKAKISATLAERYGEGIINPSQIQAVKEAVKSTNIKKHGSYEKYLEIKNKELSEGYKSYIQNDVLKKDRTLKAEKTCLERYGHKNFGAGKKAKDKRIKTMSEIIANWDYEERLSRTNNARNAVTHRGGFSSNPEKRVRVALVILDIEYIPNIFLLNYSWDMLIENKILIEVQGTMWHAHPSKYKADDLIMNKIPAQTIWDKDQRKREIAEHNGYKVVYIWEHEIDKLSDFEIIDFVSERLKSVKNNT
jgi:hypothetical protein